MPAPAAPPTPVICPECGTPDTTPSRTVIRRHRFFALIPRVTLILGLLTIATIAFATRESATYPAGAPQVAEVARVAVITWDQLRAAAKGESDGFLTRAARTVSTYRWMTPTKTPTLSVSVIAPAGDVTRQRSFGWPLSLFSMTDITGYTDFRSKSGARATTNSSFQYWYWDWDRVQVFSGPIASGTTNRRITWSVLGTCSLIVAALAVGWAGRRILGPLVLRERDPDRARRNAQRIGLCAAAVFLLLASLRTIACPNYDHESNPLSMTGFKDMTDIEFTQNGLANVLPGPTSDAHIASRTLERLPFRSSDNAIVKFVYAAPYTFPIAHSSTFGPRFHPWLRVQFDKVQWPRPSVSINWWGSSLSWRKGTETTSLSIRYDSLAPAILILILAHFLATRTTRFLLLRSALSRQRKHLCQRCAYPLPYAAPPTAP